MRTVGLLSMMLCLATCFPSGDDLRVSTNAAGGNGGSTAAAGTGGTAAGGAPGTGGYAGGAPTWSVDVKPILMAKCSPCHVAGYNMPLHTLASAYTDAKKPATNAKCYGMTVGQCTIVRIKSGEMPKTRGCTGNPATDYNKTCSDNGDCAPPNVCTNGSCGSTKTDCLTQDMQDTLQAWIDGGLKE